MYLVNYILNPWGKFANSKDPLQKHFFWGKELLCDTNKYPLMIAFLNLDMCVSNFLKMKTHLYLKKKGGIIGSSRNTAL